MDSMKEARRVRRRMGDAGEERLSKDIITEILLCLPIKTIFRFKSVSKRWLRLISDPTFARTFWSRPPVLAGFFISPKGRTTTFIPSNALTKTENLVRRVPGHSRCLASSNGLLLLDNGVWNPVTGDSFSIPDRSFHGRSKGHAFVCSGGSAPEPSISYKVVSVHSTAPYFAGGPIYRTGKLNIFTFSSDTGRWAESVLKLPRYILFEPHTKNGVVASDGVIYWLDLTWFELDGEGGSIVAYDPIDELVDLIAMPPGCVDDKQYSSCSIHRGFDGSLGLCKRNGSKVSIWGLNEEKAWSLEYKFSFDFLNDRSFEIVYLCKDQRAIYLKSKKKIVRCYVEHRKRAEEICNYAADPSTLLFPFVLPPWPLSLPQRDS